MERVDVDMMRIGIDARVLFMPVLKGIGVYLQNLLEQLAVIDQENEYVLYYDSRQETVNRVSLITGARDMGQETRGKKQESNGVRECRSDGETSPILRYTDTPLQKTLPVSRAPCPVPHAPQVTVRGISVPRGDNFYFWEQFALPAALKRDKIDLLHSPANTTCLGWNGPKVVTVHDTTMQQRPDKRPTDHLYYNIIQPIVLRGAKRLIAVSTYSKRNIVRHLRITPKKITVIPQGISSAFRILDDFSRIQAVRNRYKIDGNYILNAGGESPFKNVSRLIEAYALMVHEQRVSEQLVITGIRNKDILQRHQEEIVKAGVAGKVIVLGYVPEEDLIALYNGAVMFVYPSLMEGFGFPPLEAMACGTPAAVSRAASIPEVAGKAAVYFDGKDPRDMALKMNKILTSEELRQTLIEEGHERVKKFSWADTAAATLEVYKQAGG